ncbi:MAG: glycosyltransferase family 4 protein [Thermoleophilia bacterium]
MINIGIDAHAIGERLTGNETYVVNLLEALFALESEHKFFLFFTRTEAASEWRDRYNNAEVVMAHPAQPLVRIPIVMPWLAWRTGIDLLHVQYAGPPFLNVPLITAIHDISYERYPELFSKKEVAQFKATIPRTARKARKVLTISECSKRDLVEIYGLPENKVHVIYLGVGVEFTPEVESNSKQKMMEKYSIAGRYFIAVGNLQPRKNLVRLIEAYARLRNEQPEICNKLVIVGKKAWKHDPILAFVKNSRWVEDIIITGYVPKNDLQILYACSDALIYPSIYEGFGLPPLEAMACGAPVIVSDTSALPEVVGEAALKVDPFDTDAIAAAMALIVREPDLAQCLSAAGIKRASRFTWSKCASETMAVYEEVHRETVSKKSLSLE